MKNCEIYCSEKSAHFFVLIQAFSGYFVCCPWHEIEDYNSTAAERKKTLAALKILTDHEEISTSSRYFQEVEISLRLNLDGAD